MKWRFKAWVLILISFIATNALASGEFTIQNIDNTSWHWSSPGEIEIDEYRAKSPPEIAFSEGTAISHCRLEKHLCDPLKPIPILIDTKKIRPTRLKLTYKVGKESKVIWLQLFSRVASDFHVTGKSDLKKNIVLSPTTFAIIISPNGELVYYRAFVDELQDFRPHILNGKLFYSVLKIKTTNLNVNAEGERVIFDRNFQQVETIGRLTDSHEFLYLAPKHYLLLTYESAPMPSGACYIDQSAIEEKSGKDIYKFSAYDFHKKGYVPDSTYKFIFRGRSCIGGFHLNAVSIVDENRWLISFGNGSILLWNRKTEKPDWIFSGPEDQFDLLPEQITHRHHTPIWDPIENRLVIFDNDIYNKKTRLLDFKLDLANKKVSGFKIIKLDNGFSDFGGSVEVDNGTTFSVGFGHRLGGQWDFAEIKNGKLNMTIRFSKNNRDIYNYRAYRSPIK